MTMFGTVESYENSKEKWFYLRSILTIFVIKSTKILKKKTSIQLYIY